MKSDFLVALTQLAAERGLPREKVMSAIEAALVSAFKKDSVTDDNESFWFDVFKTTAAADNYDYAAWAEGHIADDAAQHKQSHVLQLTDAGEWTGNIVALPNNRVRVTHPAWFETGEGAPDFKPSQHIHYSKSDLDYVLDTRQIFDNLYADRE